MFIFDLLATENYFIVNRDMIKLLGLHEAILLGELSSEYRYWKKENKLENGNEFFSTRENIFENTGLSDFQQREALKNLEEKGIVSVIKKGMPAKNYYVLNEDSVVKLLNDKSLKNYTTSGVKIKGQVVKKFNIKNNKEKIIKNNNNKNSKNLKVAKILDIFYRISLEYEIEENVLEKLEEFFKTLVENDCLVSEQKIVATLNKLADVDKETQLKAIQLSLDKGYKSIDPSWLVSSSQKGEHLNLTHDTETHEEHLARVSENNNMHTF